MTQCYSGFLVSNYVLLDKIYTFVTFEKNIKRTENKCCFYLWFCTFLQRYL
jgi:hypothetical protein